MTEGYNSNTADNMRFEVFKLVKTKQIEINYKGKYQESI